MPDHLQVAIEKVRAVGEIVCEQQMYLFPGFNPEEHDPDDFFAARNLEFDGLLYVRFPARILFNPIPAEEIEGQEAALGLELPNDYKVLLATFGEFHVPGDSITGVLRSPLEAHKYAAGCFGYPESPVMGPFCFDGQVANLSYAPCLKHALLGAR